MTQITLRGDDSDRFEETRERIDRELPGSEPSNAEVVRILMDDSQY
ncbi:hypothetical protein [Haloarcula argentinensis]|uniref:Uncharacterized protein n=1 Tax=Haloarcula argentinensis TaxID=43776 RepID=A0A830F9W7_HALAR|nr:hypothetical protein [Haloarcula argentinensis]GGM26779.1 hypothetical protein GCM10009006_05310 [Haloarcula argentinensis]